MVAPPVRPWLAKMIKQRFGDTTILSYTEIPEDQKIKVFARIGISDESNEESQRELRIELIKSNGLFNGIKDISDRFGPSALILKNVKSSGQEFLVVAHENAVNETTLKSSNHNREDLIGKSQQEIEVIKDALEKLPMKINSSARRKNYAQSKTDNGNTSQKSYDDTTSVIKNNFQRLVNAAPISAHLRELLNHIVDEPSSKAELIAELRCGIMKNIPNSVDIKFDRKTHVFDGRSWRGKTSVALKIASQLDSANQNKVSIVSFGSSNGFDKLQSCELQEKKSGYYHCG